MRFQKILIAFLFITQSIFAQISEQSNSKKSDISLLQPITVTIGGNFIVTGSFTAFATQRLDHFITQVFIEAQLNALGNINDLEAKQKILDELSKYPLRNITLKRFNGEVFKIDLLKYRHTGDFSFNPYLMNDDVIIFPGYDSKTNFVEIDGAVNKPIKFQFVDGDKLSDAILFAGGINSAYDNITTAEISRLLEKGTKEELIKINLKENFNLQSGDRIKILFDENYKKEFKTLVLGEVNSPGYVYITKGRTTIKEVIKKANGFTSNAWLEKSEILRGTSESEILKMNAIRESFEKKKNFSMLYSERLINEFNVEELKLFRMADTYPQDSLTVIIDNTLRILQSKSLIDFTKLNSDTTEDGNYIVNDGDVIIIPKREELVYVFGQVKNPGFLKYIPGKKHNYYLEKAGGVGERAEDEIKIIKGTSYSWQTADQNSVIEPGDLIYVPKNVPKPFEYYLRSVASVSSVITAIATIILIVIQSGK
jgi:protein involved in polysaccharide export with SLBB domain